LQAEKQIPPTTRRGAG